MGLFRRMRHIFHEDWCSECLAEMELTRKQLYAMPEQRVAEAKKLGFKTCIIPEVSMKSVGKVAGIEVIGVKSVNQAINYLVS